MPSSKTKSGDPGKKSDPTIEESTSSAPTKKKTSGDAPVAKKKKKKSESETSDPAPKDWTMIQKLELVESIDDHLKMANAHHCMAYIDLLSKLSLYEGDDEFARHIKAYKKFDKKKPGLFEKLNWWLMPSSESELARKKLFIGFTESPTILVGENVHFYLALDALKHDKVLVDKGDLLPKFYLVKFILLAKQFFARADCSFNMNSKDRVLLKKDCATAMEAVGGQESAASIEEVLVKQMKGEDEAREILGSFLRDTGAFAFRKSWVGILRDSVEELTGSTTKKKKKSKQKSGDRLEVPTGPPRL